MLQGIWEHFTPVLFGMFTSNHLHGAVHILLGIVGLVTGLRGGARGFCIFLGALLLAVDLLWILPPSNGLIVKLFNINQPVAILNLVIALVSLAVAFFPRRSH